MGSIHGEGQLSHPLLPGLSSFDSSTRDQSVDDEDKPLTTKVWVESKKLWHIVGPAIFSRVASYSMNVITQAFAGHIGDLELAAISIANTVIVGFNFGLLVIQTSFFLPISALMRIGTKTVLSHLL